MAQTFIYHDNYFIDLSLLLILRPLLIALIPWKLRVFLERLRSYRFFNWIIKNYKHSACLLSMKLELRSNDSRMYDLNPCFTSFLKYWLSLFLLKFNLMTLWFCPNPLANILKMGFFKRPSSRSLKQRSRKLLVFYRNNAKLLISLSDWDLQ